MSGRRRTGPLVVAALALAGWAGVAVAAPAGGTLTVTEPGSSTPLDGGTATTPFGVSLPAGAHCDGDSAHDGYHVYSFLVPATASVDALRFTSIPDRGFPLVSDGVPFEAANTAESTGRVVDLPSTFSWVRLDRAAVLDADESRATWRLGIACASAHGVLTGAWTTELTFHAGSSGPLTWRTSLPEHTPANFPWSTVAPVAVAVVLAGGFLLLTRQRRTAVVAR